MTRYIAEIHAENNYYYMDCSTEEEAHQVVSRWVGLMEKTDDPHAFLEYKPFCYVRYDQILGITIREEDDRNCCMMCLDDGQTTLDDFITFDGEDSIPTVTEKEA